MSFVQTAFLSALAAVAVPVIIHLIYRWQTKRVELGTIRFLNELLRDTARRRRVKQWLLLALRTGAVALLALLFARPFAQARIITGDRKQALILVDQSGSMSARDQGERLIDRAVARVREIQENLDDNTDVELAFFDSRVTAVGKESEGESGRNRVNAPDLLFGGTSYGAAMSWARDMSLKGAYVSSDIHLLTDLQRSGLDWTTTDAFPPHTLLHIEDVGKDGLNNVSIEEASVSTRLVRPGDTLSCTVTLFNDSPFTIDNIPVLLSLSDKAETVRHRKLISIPPNQTAQVEFELQGLSDGFWEGTASIEHEDALALDNRRYFGVLASKQVPVLIVDGSSETLGSDASGYFLDKAVRLSSEDESWTDSPFASQRIFYESTGRLPTLAGMRIVVLVDVAAVSAADAANLEAFVRSGGAVLVFTGEKVNATSFETLAEAKLAPGTFDGIEYGDDLPFRWDQWDETDPVLEVFADPQHGDLQRLAFTAFTRIKPDANTKVLAKFPGGHPALTRHEVGAGQVLWFLSSADDSWGGWLRSRLYVPLVHQMLASLSGLSGEGPVRLLTLESSIAGEQSISTAQVRPGIVATGNHWDVANVPSRESDLGRFTPEEFAERFRVRLHGQSEAAAASAGSFLAGEQRPEELWPWFACLLMGLLAAEWFVANRTTL